MEDSEIKEVEGVDLETKEEDGGYRKDYRGKMITDKNDGSFYSFSDGGKVCISFPFPDLEKSVRKILKKKLKSKKKKIGDEKR